MKALDDAQSSDGAAATSGTEADRSLAPAVTRAVAIMNLLAVEGTSLGVSAIARHLDLPKSSVANLCNTLQEADLLRPVDSGFGLGRRLAQLGAAYLAGVDQVGLFHDYSQQLDAGREETAQLALLGDRLDVIYLARRDGLHPVRLASRPGRALPATCTATGKAMLAALDDEELTQRLASPILPRLTPRSITTVRQLHREVAAIRQRGYAVDQEEVIEGVVCVAAAIPNVSADDSRLAVSFTLLRPRATPERIETLGAEVCAFAANIGIGLGAPG